MKRVDIQNKDGQNKLDRWPYETNIEAYTLYSLIIMSHVIALPHFKRFGLRKCEVTHAIESTPTNSMQAKLLIIAIGSYMMMQCNPIPTPYKESF